MENTITKKNMYEALINLADNNEFGFYDKEENFVSVDWASLKNFAEHELALLSKRAERSKEYAAKKKKAESDELMDIVFDAVGDEFEPISNIAMRVAEVNSDATISKITYRLTKLAESGKVEKTDIKVKNEEGKTCTLKGYKRIVTE